MYKIIKRIFDILVSSILLLVLSLLLIITAVIIKFSSPGPIFYRAARSGLNGEPFLIFKFRTMYVGADKGSGTTALNDPRITSCGMFLRSYKLDELPQLLNVIKGDMSLVGPRPLFKEDTSKFDENYMRRLNVLPGITGLLQINERNTDEFKVWYKYDIEYINNWNILLDIKILLKTPKSIFKNKTKGL